MSRINQLHLDIIEFDEDFEENGPMIPGIPAKEANRRVQIFQLRFDDLWQLMNELCNGEELFGMSIHEYPSLQNRKKQFNMLNRLYQLYNEVGATIAAYKLIPWGDVNMEKVTQEVSDFDLRYDLIYQVDYLKASELNLSYQRLGFAPV